MKGKVGQKSCVHNSCVMPVFFQSFAMSVFYKDWELEKGTNIYPRFLIEKRIRTFLFS